MEKRMQFGSISFMKFSDGSPDGYGGTAKVPRLLPETKIRLVPNTNKRGDQSPDFWIEAPAYDEQANESYWAGAGAAWWKEAKETGLVFLSLNIDLADAPAEVPMAAFKADEDDQPKKGEGGELWRLTYSRPRARRASASREDTSRPMQIDDEIPY